jgi:hypothetical protein
VRQSAKTPAPRQGRERHGDGGGGALDLARLGAQQLVVQSFPPVAKGMNKLKFASERFPARTAPELNVNCCWNAGTW